MKIINLTPHDIMYSNRGKFQVIKTSGEARCLLESRMIGSIGEIPVYQNTYGQVVGLPDEEEGTYYVVSRIVAEAMKGKRNDLFIVDKTIRDDKGFIVGFQAFARV